MRDELPNLRNLAPWTVVRIFGSLTYFNISYVVLLLVPIIHELYARAVPIMGWFGAPGEFPVTLQWLYAASLIFALAILLYQLFCPSEIKRHSQPVEYVRSQYDIFQRADPQHRINVVLARLDPIDDEKYYSEIEELNRIGSTADSAPEREHAQLKLDMLLSKLHGHAVQKWLLVQYTQKDTSWPLARWLVLSLYLAGCIILVALLAIRSFGVFTDYRENRMQIRTEISNGSLNLLAYTYQENEFSILENVLKSADASNEYRKINTDKTGRMGRLYSLSSPQIRAFGQAVGGSFDARGVFSTSAPISGSQYACKEKKMGGADGKGCQEFSAPDDHAAFIACGLIAGQHGWYFGVHRSGTCNASRSWRPW